jgi:UDP-N-acetylmuramoyl-L-alanyl-D-glutamate--2,6-diaminopimelate ligase
MHLSSIHGRLHSDGHLVDGTIKKDLEIRRVVFDSRDVRPGDCFVAIRGGAFDGHMFIDKAVYNGAIAIVCEATSVNSEEGLSDVAYVHVTNGREALLSLASEFYNNPAANLTMIGTTGTNGKTTVATLVTNTLGALDIPCGFIGTTGYSFGDIQYPATATTPAPTDVYRLLSEMQNSGAKACSMEVSSHALDQHRVRAADFDVAIFTNLTRDHLDYHLTESAYLAAKKVLFDGLNSTSTAVVNAGDSASEALVADSSATCLYYGTQEGVDIQYRILGDDATGLKLELDGQKASFRLSGAFNAENIAAAYGAGIGLGIDGGRLIKALADAPAVRGRFELLPASSERSVIIDYAHTPDALENVLKEARTRTSSDARLWCIFGCGGDRDKGKRSLMGEIASRLADRVVITDDNPRTERSADIIADVMTGVVETTSVVSVSDRRSAIQFVAAESGAGDVILIAGKGHETVQVVGSEKFPFDDLKEAREAFLSESDPSGPDANGGTLK